MSCNGCRVLRKGCSEECMLRHCLLWIENPQAQGHATLFVAKFFGRAALMSFISSVPTNQRSGLFKSLLYEAVGRSINPVNGAVGLLWSGKWYLCHLGVDKVLRGGTPLPQGFVDCSSSQGGCSRLKRLNMVQQAKKQPSQESDTTTTTLGSSTPQDCPNSQTETKALTLFF